MAQEDDIKQNIIIEVKESGVNEAAKDVQALGNTIDNTTEAQQRSTAENKKAEQQQKSLKTQLREANAELQRSIQTYGETSQEAVKAAKAVAELNDQMGFARDLADAFNPDQKFKALGAATQLAATGVSSVVSGMALFGEQSEDTEAALLKVQAAMAFSDSVSQLSNLGDQFQILKASIMQSTIAQRIWNLVAKANPYVLIASAVAAVGVAVYSFVKITGDAAKKERELQDATESLTTSIEDQSKAYEKNVSNLSKQNEHKIALLRASGASEKQIYAETKALQDQELQLAKNFRAEAIRAEQKAYELNRDNGTDATKKVLKDAQDNLAKAEKAVSDGFDNLIKLQNNFEVARVQAETDARNKAEEKRKAAAEKAAQAEKERREKAHAKALEQRKKELDEMNALADENETYILKQREKLNTQKVESAEKERQNFLTKSAEQYAAEKVILDKRIEDDKAELEAKKANQDALVSGAENLVVNVAKLAGKNKAIQKAAIIADGGISLGKAVANTAEAVTKDLAKGAPFSAPLVALDLAVGATSIASIIQGTNKALQAVGGGSAPSAATLPGPVRNVAQVGFQASSENQIANSINQSQGGQQVVKAIVVSSEITTAQQYDNAKLLQNKI